MIRRLVPRLAVPAVAAAMLAFASAASASVTPTVTPSSTAPLTAGATGNLGLDLKFSPSQGDSPKDLTLNLPPGLLSNAAINRGGCLKTVDIATTSCQIGSGTVHALLLGMIPVPTNVGFFLVPPPAAGDLAGLAVASNGDQIGTTAAITIRPSGNPAGVGATIHFVLPNTLDNIPLEIQEISSTFNGLRFPTSCPATPAQLTVSVDSYADATVKTAATPVPVTGCSALAFSPKYSINVARDASDKNVRVTTQITQAATESPSSAVTLGFPSDVFSASLKGLTNLCTTGPASGKCTPVGSVQAASPLYPTPLTGRAYLTGNVTNLKGLTLTLVFPQPFPLTLVGAVHLENLTTTFSGLPDIPLTHLTVTLNGGPAGLFSTLCTHISGVSTARLTDQNGDKTATVKTPFTETGCPAHGGGGGGTHGGSGKAGRPRIHAASFGGLRTRKPTLRFTVTAGTHRPGISSLAVKLPKGLNAVTKRTHGKRMVRHVSVKGAKLRSATVSHGALVIKLRKAARRALVRFGRGALSETHALAAKVRRAHVKSLRLTVVVRNAKGKRTTLHVKAKT
ncbi:MAG TPA: hypothetical protein VFW09_10700 [Solirubrobacteraceae bacterium]|nr:hypothetical protein [Solirubrobacteraceae bacterium]